MKKLLYITSEDSKQTVEGVTIDFWKVVSIELNKNKVTIKSKNKIDTINFPNIVEANKCHIELSEFLKSFQQ